MRTFTKKQVAVTGVAAVVVLGTGTAAYAYWTSTGSGTGSATTSAGAANLTLEQTSSVINMYPGDAAQSLVVKVTNNAENAAYVTSVTGVASVTQAPGAVGACDPTDYTYNGSPLPANGAFTMTWAPVDLASGGSQSTAGDSIKFNNKTTNQDGCKGATVDFAYSAQ
ncbi:hypothetical protein KC207_12730 [Phycicoccus sp. BSK3Z-2]|uniref:Uncharacterized protein n=1 Tax=Phycicoccus avicenniae TaxID=2828860 RepID=A0A941DBX4_9MICO|nr:hypothetical protein [Phycicoccus avicenniae]MBR7744152.1 hypothetical protein [Phycicoccus avicenniae]